jgi:1,2-diacylglycerol 3-alpha-glucosyltransferase
VFWVKILITTDFYLPHITGVTTVVVNEQNMLGQLGHEVRLLTIGNSPVSSYKAGVYYMKGSRLQPLRDSQLTFSYHDPLLADILSWSPDIVHSNNEFFTMGWAKRIARALQIPLIHTCHTDFTRFDAQHRIRHTLWDTMMATIIKRRVRYCDLLISPSLSHSHMLERYHIKQPIFVLPSGIDLARFQRPVGSDEIDALRTSLGFSKEHCILVSVCRLASEKRVNKSIDDFFLLSFLEPSARLLLVGGGPKEDSLKKQVADLGLEGLVVFAGAIPSENVHLYYRLSDVFISSSVRESQGLGFVEAMASSLPVVLREDHSLGFSVEEEGCGAICADSHSFVTTLASLVADEQKRKEMAEKSKQASERFSLSHWAETLVSVCETTLDTCGKGNNRGHHHQSRNHAVQ